METAAIRTQIPPSGHKEHATSIYMSSSFLFDNAEQARAVFAKEQEGYIYSRYGNPNITEFVDKMCLLEGAEAGTGIGLRNVGRFFGRGRTAQQRRSCSCLAFSLQLHTPDHDPHPAPLGNIPHLC